MKQDQQADFSDEQQKVLESIQLSKIIVPIILGVLVVLYLIWRQFDIEEFQKIRWNTHVLFWIILAILAYVIRHLFYAWRLKVLSSGEFGWIKSIELIFIWEFASSVSPTSIGGSAVALFLLAQEKISSAKTVAIVIYSVVLDTLFFVSTIPILYFFMGPIMIRPGMESFNILNGFGLTLVTILFFMTAYGIIFFYGLFINPIQIKRLLIGLSRWKFLKRFRKGLRETALDIVSSSNEMKNQNFGFHLKVFLSTSGAWIFRFLAINSIIIALVSTRSFSFWDNLIMYGRGEVMYVVTAFSPTPGGSGIAEIVFGGFYSDFISKALATFAALFWRLITYYPYLIIGVILIPNWIRNLVNRRKAKSAN